MSIDIKTKENSDALVKGEYIHDQISSVIKESEDLITALEHVGAMYGIPSSNIIVDNSLNSIRVRGDNIIAPESKNTTGNTKAIICSIGAVLDNISQRIDDKLEDFQTKEINIAKRASVRRDSNPSKGNVMGRYVDSNGDEVIVYDTGFIDTAHTPEGYARARELREEMGIPSFHIDNKKPTYFSDEDDITSGLDISNDTIASDTDVENVSISDTIQESSDYIDLMANFNDTRHLGYDLLKSQGFDYVKTFQESSSSKNKKNLNNIRPDDIKYMKFDNTNIIKAIEFFNEARADQPNAVKGKFKISDMVNHPSYQKAIDCLNKQFNARINIRFIEDMDEENNLFTTIWKDIKNNLTVSKSKGFQLNGLPIDIFVINKAIDEESDGSIELFGQFVVSSLLHEIFHNIYAVMFKESSEFNSMLASTLAIASSIDDAKKRRIILTNYVNALNESRGKKIGRFARRRLVKHLLYLTAFQHDEKILETLEKQLVENKDSGNSDKDIDELIRMYEAYTKKHKKRQKSKLRKLSRTAIGLLMCLTIVLLPIGVTLISDIDEKHDKEYKSSKELEEYYCDLFAGMYKLPIAFLIGMPDNRKWTSNQIDQEKLNKLAMLEKEVREINYSIYPSTSERNLAAVKIAKNLLEIDNELDPSIKKYLEWIVDNHSNILNTDIEEIYNTTTFDPKTAENLDKHLQTLITGNNITLTESDISWILDDGVVCESVDRVNDKGESVPERCPYCGSKVGLFLKGEPVWLCSNKKCEKYFGTLPCDINEYSVVSDTEIMSSLLNCYQEMLTILDQYSCQTVDSLILQESVFSDAKGSSSENIIIRILKFIPRLIMGFIKSMKNAWNNRKSQQLIRRIEALEKLSQEQKEKIDELVNSKNSSVNNNVDYTEKTRNTIKHDQYLNEIKINKKIDDMQNEISEINRKIDILGNNIKTDLNFAGIHKFFEDILAAFSILEKWDYNKPNTMNKKSVNQLKSMKINTPKLLIGELKTYSFEDIKKYSNDILVLYEQISFRGNKIQEKFNGFIEEYEKYEAIRPPSPSQTERNNNLIAALQSVVKYITLGKTFADGVNKGFSKLSDEFNRYARFVGEV